MKQIKSIIVGHVNELLHLANLSDQNKEKIFSQRKVICESCPLKNGNRCDPNFVIDDEFEKTEFDSKTMKKFYDKNHLNKGYFVTRDGKKFYKGCGCRLSAKQRDPNSACPAGLWGGEFNK